MFKDDAINILSNISDDLDRTPNQDLIHDLRLTITGFSVYQVNNYHPNRHDQKAQNAKIVVAFLHYIDTEIRSLYPAEDAMVTDCMRIFELKLKK